MKPTEDRHPMRQLFRSLFLLLVAAPVRAQSGREVTLSLEEALDLARHNNPAYLVSVNSRNRAEGAVRTAYGAFLPSANTSFATSYRQGKPQFFAGVAFGSNSDILSSSWGLDVGARVSAATFGNLRRNRANLDAADADVTSAAQTLRTTVTQQYLLVLQADARAALQDSLVTSTELQLALARAKEGVGSATALDVKRAEVAVGQQQVASLRAHNLAEVALLQLFQQLGVPKPERVRLTSAFTVTEPSLDVQQLLSTASRENPSLRALRAREEAAAASYRSARGEYLPSLSVGAGFGGFTQKYRDDNYLVSQAQAQALASAASCWTTDSLRRGAGMPSIASRCSSYAFTEEQAGAIRSSNNSYPFRFTSSPYTFSLSLSVPLFDGFNREQQVKDASAARLDARYNIRAQELRLTADVTSAYSTLVADYRTFRLQELNAQAAREALQLAQERYRVGLNSLVDLQQARSDYERAETDRIDALFEYHRAFAALEAAVGRTLR